MRKLGWAVVVVVVGCSKPADKPAGEPTAMAAGSGSAHRKREDRREPVVAHAPPLKLDVVVRGTTITWSPDAFARVPQYTVGNDGEARDVWSLRELVHQLVGPTARVTQVTGHEGTQPVDEAAWGDPQRTPLLHTTRRGTLKFRWADAHGTWGESAVRDVTRIDLAP